MDAFFTPECRMINLKAVFICLLIISPSLLGQVYKYIDENGNLVYSDTPPPNKQDMQPAELPDIIVQPSVKVPERSVDTDPQTRDIDISISSPTEGATILATASSFNVSATVSKKLFPHESVRLLVNGTPHASSTTKALNWRVTDLIRGEYLLSAEVLDENQKVIASSSTVTVFVKRTIAR